MKKLFGNLVLGILLMCTSSILQADSTFSERFAIEGQQVGQISFTDLMDRIGIDKNEQSEVGPVSVCVLNKGARFDLILNFDSERDQIFSNYKVRKSETGGECLEYSLLGISMASYVGVDKTTVKHHFGEDQLLGSADKWEYIDESSVLNFDPIYDFTRVVKHRDGDVRIDYYIRGWKNINLLVFSFDDEEVVQVELSNNIEPLYSTYRRNDN